MLKKNYQLVLYSNERLTSILSYVWNTVKLVKVLSFSKRTVLNTACVYNIFVGVFSRRKKCRLSDKSIRIYIHGRRPVFVFTTTNSE